MDPIKFILGEESRPKIETFSDVDHSLFKDQYEKVFEEIISYVLDKPTNNDPNSENKNNLFAFIGERGSGKTSCMLSVANMLTTSNKTFAETFKTDLTKKLDDEKFITIDLVDPSFFDQKHNILDIVIAKLFKSFSDDVKKSAQNKQQNYESKKQILINKFQETKENLNQLLNTSNSSDDSLEQLTGLAAAVDLKDNLKKLFDAYLEYFLYSDNTTSKGYLLIKIDDIDLHTKHAYEMVEQIRKYIIQPNVIILLSVKLDQLSNVVKLQYTKEFRALIENRVTDMNYIDEMVEKYLAKLLPFSNRIYIPDAYLYFYRPLKVYSLEGTHHRVFNSIREAVPMLIFEKTRFLFYNALGATSYIVPRNLRELRHLIKLLFDMKNYHESKKDKNRNIEEKPIYNKTIFKKYLFETWAVNNLDSNGLKVINGIINVSDTININKSVVKLLKSRFNKVLSSIEEKKTIVDLSYILNDENQTYNISIGDVLSIITYLQGVSTDESDYKLFFLIKSFYSIKLYESYDEITESHEINKPVTNIQEVFRNEFLSGYSNYAKIVAGNFINSMFIDIIPPNKSKEVRSQRRIDVSIIYIIINQLARQKSEYIYVDKIKLSRIDALRLVELFALTTSRKYDSKDENTDNLYRTKREVFYAENLSEQRKNIYFDLASIFYNLTNIQNAYERFSLERNDNNLYKIALNENDSILSGIKHMVCQRNELDENNTSLDIIQNKLLSWVSIRNIEVLEALIIFLQKRRPKGDSTDIRVISDFFNNVKRFAITTYDKTPDEKDHYRIDFSFLDIFHKFLLNNTDIRPLFDEIYKMENTKVDKVMYKIVSININLGLKSKGKYDRNALLEKLLNKNSMLNDNEKIMSFFNIVFNQNSYTQQEANQKLIELKNMYNG